MTGLEQAAIAYLQATDEIGQHLKTCLKCKVENPSTGCSAGFTAFKKRDAAYAAMSRAAFVRGLR